MIFRFFSWGILVMNCRSFCKSLSIGFIPAVLFFALGLTTLILLLTDHYQGLVETLSYYEISKHGTIVVVGWATVGIYFLMTVILVAIGMVTFISE